MGQVYWNDHSYYRDDKIEFKRPRIDARITNRIQEIEETISGAEDIIGNNDTTKRKCKM